MGTVQQEIIVKEDASKLFIFDEVYSFRAAQEQAEKKKLNAFGMIAKLNPLKRPKDETVQMTRHESRYEPFWVIEATKAVDYQCQITYSVPIHNPYVQSVSVADSIYEVSRSKDKAKIDIEALETCHRKIYYSSMVDGLKRETKKEIFASYIEKYKYSEKTETKAEQNIIEPLLPQQTAIEEACAKLNSQTINAHEVQQNIITFDKVNLFLVPVFAFEFVWGTADKTGVIEVNGLTGEVVEDGVWYKDKMSQLLTREMLLEISADVAGELIPGGGIAIKVAGKLAEN